jgi:hypothetical protein
MQCYKKKHGRSNFKLEILEYCEPSPATKEKHIISFFLKA